MKLVPTSINPVTITLYRGIPFDNKYEEHTLLSQQFKFSAYHGSSVIDIGANKEAFINMQRNGSYIYPRSVKSGTYNFAFGNGLVTSVVMELTGNEINSNYMKVVSDGDSYYYFITGITQKNEVTYLLNLELDVVMTYSEEFLTNIKDKPVMVERKHCRRVQRTRVLTTTTTKINPVCFNQESTFSRVKSNIVKEFTPLEFKDFINGNDNFNDIMKELNWVYVIIGESEAGIRAFDHYIENGVYYPYAIGVFPTQPLKVHYNVGGESRTLILEPYNQFYSYVGQPSVQKIIISPFPPFKECSNIRMVKETSSRYYEMYIETLDSHTSIGEFAYFYTGDNNTGSYMCVFQGTSQNYPLMSVEKGYGGKFEYSNVNDYFNVNIPSVSNTRDIGEYKLQIAPFKDLRMSSYYGGEVSIHTQYLFLQNYSSGVYDIKPYTIASSNAEVNSYFDYVDVGNNSVESKRGVSNSVAYNYPTGTDAELLYAQTQKNQYETSKTITAINNGLKIVGGALALTLLPSAKAKVGGAIAVTSGVAGIIENDMSYYAKMEDLASTPNTYNFAGSSYAYDKALAESGVANVKSILPYLITYGVSSVEENMASEFLYEYGYEYNTMSKFSTLLTHNTDYVFERRLFNYVKIRENISTKLVGDNLPIIVAQKINEILNAGIKLWTFFGFNFSSSQDVTDIVDSYFQKDRYCNAEVVYEQFE